MYHHKAVYADHLGDAAVPDADSDFSLLRLTLSVGHTDDVSAVGGLDVTHRAGDRHIDFTHGVAAVRQKG